MYYQWGVVQISLANLIVIATMIAVFALAVAVPFPRDRARSEERAHDERS